MRSCGRTTRPSKDEPCGITKKARRKENSSPDGTSAKGEFFARRYERAALLTLFAFLEGVVDRWLKEAVAAAGAEPVGLTALSDKCRYLTQLACLPPFRGITYDAARLLTFTGRYEQADLALLEHVDGSLLQAIEDEAAGARRRQPPAGHRRRSRRVHDLHRAGDRLHALPPLERRHRRHYGNHRLVEAVGAKDPREKDKNFLNGKSNKQIGIDKAG